MGDAFPNIAARVGEHADGALAAQKAIYLLLDNESAEDVLLLSLPRDASDDFRRGFLRVIEKSLARLR